MIVNDQSMATPSADAQVIIHFRRLNTKIALQISYVSLDEEDPKRLRV